MAITHERRRFRTAVAVVAIVVVVVVGVSQNVVKLTSLTCTRREMIFTNYERILKSRAEKRERVCVYICKCRYEKYVGCVENR